MLPPDETTTSEHTKSEVLTCDLNVGVCVNNNNIIILANNNIEIIIIIIILM